MITIAVAGALGAGSALGLAACGEDRGSLSIEGTTTGGSTTGGTGTTSTTPSTGTTSTTPTATPAQ
jgi:hypothetical protein